MIRRPSFRRRPGTPRVWAPRWLSEREKEREKQHATTGLPARPPMGGHPLRTSLILRWRDYALSQHTACSGDTAARPRRACPWLRGSIHVLQPAQGSSPPPVVLCQGPCHSRWCGGGGGWRRGGLKGCPSSSQIIRTTAESQRIVAARPLCRLQYRVRPKSSARDLPRWPAGIGVQRMRL